MSEYYVDKNSCYEYDGVRYARNTYDEAGMYNSLYGVMFNLRLKDAKPRQILQDDFKWFHSYVLSYLHHDKDGKYLNNKDRIEEDGLDSPPITVDGNEWGVKDGKYCCKSNHRSSIWIPARPEDVPECVKNHFKLAKGGVEWAYNADYLMELAIASIRLIAGQPSEHTPEEYTKECEEKFEAALEAVIGKK